MSSKQKIKEKKETKEQENEEKEDKPMGALDDGDIQLLKSYVF